MGASQKNTTIHNAIDSLPEYILTETEFKKLRKRAEMFSARREVAIGWIDQTLLALRQAKRALR